MLGTHAEIPMRLGAAIMHMKCGLIDHGQSEDIRKEKWRKL
jgi:hypothetical protein